MNVYSYYLLWVCLAGTPCQDWRVEGGWDSCLLMEQMVLRYAPAPILTRCERVEIRR